MTEAQAEELERQLRERFPVLGELHLTQDGADVSAPLPVLSLILLSSLLNDERGALAILLPGDERFAIALAVLTALHSIRSGFEQLELERLTTPFQSGQLVRVAPSGKVYEFFEDNRKLDGYSGIWFGLRNPRSNQISYHRVEEQFRLTPTDNPSPSPTKRERPEHWSLAPIDRMLDIRTGGNLAIIPNQVMLVAPRSRTADLVGQAVVGRGAVSAPLGSTITWGRVGTGGELISEDLKDRDRPPIIAVTHSIDLMALACRKAESARTVIVSGIDGMGRNLQAFDDVSKEHRLIVLGNHDDVSAASELAHRGATVWAPPPALVLTGCDGELKKSSWLAPDILRSSNADQVTITIDRVVGVQIVKLATEILQIEETVADAPDGQRLIRRYWRVLTRLNEWIGTEGMLPRDAIVHQLEDMDSILRKSRQWISGRAAQRCEKIHELILDAVKESSALGDDKGVALLRRARSVPECCVVTRSSEAAARAAALLKREGIERQVYPRDSLPVDASFTEVVWLSWPGRPWASRVVSRYLAPSVSVIAYDFEATWAESFRDRWLRYWTKHRLDAERTCEVTGLSGLVDDDEMRAVSSKPVEVDEAVADDPIERFLTRVRKGDTGAAVTVEEARECYYVGFIGPRYAYLTETCEIPVLTELIRSSGEGAVRSIPRRAVRKLRLGDYVLFRDAGDSDVIALIAALEMGEDTYRQLRQIADQWREPLRSIGTSVNRIYRRLSAAGLQRNRQTVRMWLSDPEQIGPATLGDLQTIARASGDSTLKDDSERIHNAIRSVRGAHIQAGSTLSNLLLKQLPESTWEMGEKEKHIDLGFGGGWVVCIEDIAEESELRMPADVNRLLVDEDY